MDLRALIKSDNKLFRLTVLMIVIAVCAMNLTEGYILEEGLDEDNNIIGYKFVNLGKMMDFIKAGDDGKEAIEKASGTYGRFDEAVKKIDPRKE